MQTLSVNGYDMAYLDVGQVPPCRWSACTARWAISAPGMPCSGPLSKKHRVIALSLRQFFPEHWDGVGTDYLMAQHVADVIGFIEQLERRSRST